VRNQSVIRCSRVLGMEKSNRRHSVVRDSDFPDIVIEAGTMASGTALLVHEVNINDELPDSAEDHER